MDKPLTTFPTKLSRRRIVPIVCLLPLPLLLPLVSIAQTKQPPVLTKQQQTDITTENQTIVKSTTEKLKASPDSSNLLSQRADAFFNLRQFDKAVADYDRMVKLNPALDASHWRRGIAYFYAKQYKKAAGQFERYHSFDDVDRENGIWRFFSQYQAYGEKKAKAGLLKYRKDDREPFPSVYKLFADQMTATEILSKIDSSSIKESDRKQRLFYAHLYIGLNEAVEGRTKPATKHLRKATANQWARTAGFGPNYMWHVGRVHLWELENTKETDDTKPTPKPPITPKPVD